MLTEEEDKGRGERRGPGGGGGGRPPYENRGENRGESHGGSGQGDFQSRPRSDHPLAQQFRRERGTSSSSDWRNKTGSRFTKKPRY